MQSQTVGVGYMQSVINGMHAKFNSQLCNQRYYQTMSGTGALRQFVPKAVRLVPGRPLVALRRTRRA
jgi:hypothetical protein